MSGPPSDLEPSRSEPGSDTPPGDMRERLEHTQSPEPDQSRSGVLSPDEPGFAPGVPQPVKSRLLQLIGKLPMTPEEIKHGEYLAKRRNQWRRRKERKSRRRLSVTATELLDRKAQEYSVLAAHWEELAEAGEPHARLTATWFTTAAIVLKEVANALDKAA